MQIVCAEVAVSGGHLDGSMAQNSAQVVKIASILDKPACERVAQVVPPEVDQAGPLACGDKAVFHIDISSTIGLCEQVRVFGLCPRRSSSDLMVAIAVSLSGTRRGTPLLVQSSDLAPREINARRVRLKSSSFLRPVSTARMMAGRMWLPLQRAADQAPPGSESGYEGETLSTPSC